MSDTHKQPDQKIHICDVEDDCIFYTDFRAVMEPQTMSSPKNTSSRQPLSSPKSPSKEKVAGTGKFPPPFMPLKEACSQYHEFQEIVSYWDIE